MPPNSSDRSRPRRPRPVSLAVTVLLLGVAAWWLRMRAVERRIAGDAAVYAQRVLPETDSPIDTALAALGAEIFRIRCSACHTITGESRVGPDLSGVTSRRSFDWIERMILRPDSMTTHDPVAMALKKEYEVQMLTPDTFERGHALALIEFLRRVDGRLGGPGARGAGRTSTQPGRRSALRGTSMVGRASRSPGRGPPPA